eukprot:5467371-Karenia_brevis.AAC.1
MAYVQFQENAVIHNSILGCIGQGHQHPCGIPQGCPLSMVFVSLYLRAWMQQMTSIHAIPRSLADDVMLLARGSRALHIFQRGFEDTMSHLIDMGGRLAPRKSKVFSNVDAYRLWLQTYEWLPIQSSIDVVHNMRDLGASLN